MNNLMEIFGGVHRGFPVHDEDKEKIPHAVWANPAGIIKNLAYQSDQILLGALGNQLIGIKDDMHIITVAGSRSGKGVSAIIPNLIKYRGSVLVIDPKGELASITARRRAIGLKQKVCVLDPFNRTSKAVQKYKASFNPLLILRPDNPTIIEDAGLISDALVVSNQHTDPHWDESARSFIEGVILHVVTYEGYSGTRNLVKVYELLSKGKAGTSGNAIDALVDEMIHNAQSLKNRDVGDAVEAAALDFGERPSNEKGSVLSTIRRHIRFLGYRSMKNVLEGHDFDLTELKTAPQGMTIYLCLPAGRMGTCNRWLRLFVNLALEAMEREPKKPDPPVLLCLDEFPVLGYMKQIEDAAGQIAGFGVKLWPILQDLSQLKGLYSERWETFLGNAGVLQFFGNSDLTTLEFIEKRLGRSGVKVRRESFAAKEAISNDSYGVEMYPLITVEEGSRLFSRKDKLRRQLIIASDIERPMILQRVLYFNNPHFEGQFDVLGQ